MESPQHVLVSQIIGQQCSACIQQGNINCCLKDSYLLNINIYKRVGPKASRVQKLQSALQKVSPPRRCQKCHRTAKQGGKWGKRAWKGISRPVQRHEESQGTEV